jgi:hypothetical protein
LEPLPVLVAVDLLEGLRWRALAPELGWFTELNGFTVSSEG